MKFLILVCCIYSVHSVYYDTYKGSKISNEEFKSRERTNTTFWCSVDVKLPCDPHEWRRIDGSCNNLHQPPRGAIHTPAYRVLPAYFNDVDEPRPSKSGDPLPLPRLVRTSVLPQGKVPDKVLSQLVSYFSVYVAADVAAIHDTLNYVLWKTKCCEPEGRADRDCVNNYIPDDDPVRRFSDVRCMNLTRPITFQSQGCVANGTTPVRIISNTPAFDLSGLYGASQDKLNEARELKGGLLKQEIENGKVWPPSVKSPLGLCLLNQIPKETRCHKIPEEANNSLLGQNLLNIWFWRHHNRVAERLSKINPCWDDDKLFYTAREINIGVFMQILYYEFLPLMLGFNNLVRDGVISLSQGFRDVYNEHTAPAPSVEYLQIMRWFHTIQDGAVKMYDTEGYYLKQVPVVNLTLRTGYLAVDDNIDYITQGTFRQRSAKVDHLIDPDFAELILGPHQKASDVGTSDVHKNRLFGLAPYIKYRQSCFGKYYHNFEELIEAMDEERVEILKELYKNLEDIDLMAGIWSERPIRGGFVPQTMYCLVVEYQLKAIISDRHWYERPNRPHAFTLPQLLEIRKATISRFLCDVGDKVTQIQPKAFLRPGHGNEICSCHTIPEINLYAWKDFTWCTVNVKLPCDQNEWRRIDGSCNNLQQPPGGEIHTPTYKWMNLDRLGDGLRLPRLVRPSVLPLGIVPDTFCLLWFHTSRFTYRLLSRLSMIPLNYILWKAYCCEVHGKVDRDCVPNDPIPDDDLVHRFSNVRCMNRTRPLTFQSEGCHKNGTWSGSISYLLGLSIEVETF